MPRNGRSTACRWRWTTGPCKLTALQQPVAQDVRFLFMASRIGGELERIADQAINICQNAAFVLEAPPLKPLVDLPIMSEIAQKMVRDSLTAMINRDVGLANQVLEEEEKVDAFRDQIFRTLLTHMMADPGTIQRAISLILIARNLERIGDHATNIAEEVIYWIQGRDVRHGKGLSPARPGAAGAEPVRESGRGLDGDRVNMGTVLVIDDERDLVELVRYNLERAGFDVIEAHDGRSGLGIATAHRPDLIVLDVMMAGLDGLEVCRLLHGDSRSSRIPIIMLTARAEETDRIVGLELGADDYVTKPFSPRELVARVKAVLRRGSRAGHAAGHPARRPGH